MQNKRMVIAALVLGVLTFSGAGFAHHSSAAFDMGKKITMKGTVTEWGVS